MKIFYEERRAVPRLTREILFTLLCWLICGLFNVALAQDMEYVVKDTKRAYDFSLFDAVKVRPYNVQRWNERARQEYPKVDFNKFPLQVFKVDGDKIPKIQIGEKLPDTVLDMPLWVVNDEFARDTLTLRDCMDRTWLILDVWLETCYPCLGSMDKWEEMSKTDTSFTLLGVYYTFYPHSAMPETRKRGYLSSQVIGPATGVLTQLFMHGRKSLGPSIWIKNGRFFGVSEANRLNEEDYRLLLDGKLDAIPDYAVWKSTTN